MALDFDEEAHAYYWQGVRVPNVTSILGRLDEEDLARIPPAVLEYARLRGTMVHKACEFYDQGRLNESSIDPQIAGYVAGWKRFRAETGYVPELTEYRFYNETLGYAGCLDSMGKFRGGWAILDRKTGAPLPSHGPQLAAYQHAPMPDDSRRAFRRFAIQLTSDGDYKVHPYTDSADWRVFVSLLNVNEWRTKHGK